MDDATRKRPALTRAWRTVDRAVPLLVKISLPSLVVAVVAAVLTGNVLADRTAEEFSRAYERQARMVAHVVAADYRSRDDLEEMTNLLHSIRSGAPEIGSIRIYREQDGQRVLWATSGSPADGDAKNSTHLYTVGTPTEPGWVELTIADAELRSAISDTRDRVLRLNLLSVGLVLGMCALILYAFGLRRASRLARAAKRVANGDFTVRLPEGEGPAGRDSLVRVAREFDRMVRVVEARELQLEEAERRYRALVEQLPATVYVEENDDLATPSYISPHYEKMLGYTPEERIADPGMWTRIIHPDDRDRVMGEHLTTNLTGSPFRCEYRLIAKDGRVVWVRDEALLLADADGRRRWQGILIDITERRDAEEALRRVDNQKQSILDSAGEGVWGLDAQGRVTFVNPAAAQMTGWSPDELMGRSTHELIHHTREDGTPYPREECPIYASVSEGARYHVEGELFWRRDGSCFPVEYTVTPIFEDGEVAGAVVMFADITERSRADDTMREAYEREREAADRLRDVDEMKNAFLSAVSHELRTPLSAVLGYAVTLQQEELDLPEEDRKEMLDRLAANARKLQHLLADLLDLDRIARGILEPQRHLVDVADLVLRVTEEVEVNGHSVSVNAEPIVMELDGPKIERIVENLVMNAVKHTAKGTSVRVEVRPDHEGVLILVEDEGAGVPEHLKEAIFQPFERGEASNGRVSSGTGIGLSLVARFAELHGGRAWVENRPEGGASFRVFLPGARSEVSRPPVAAHAR